MKARVLIVDDEEPIRRNFRALLEDLGHSVEEAASGAEGLASVERARPDIVLTDLRMRSSHDGLQLVSALRAFDDALPVVVVSGSGTLHDAIDAVRRGAWDYLVKPVQLGEELIVAIDRNLERARLLQENRRYRAELEEMVAERTQSLLAAQRDNETLQTRLMVAQKLESLGLLAGGIAHDLNNLLTLVVCGLDEIRQAHPHGEEEAWGMIDDGVKQASELTRQVFIFSGRAPARSSTCDVRELVSGIEALLRSAMKSGLTLKTNLGPVPNIAADPVQLRQVVMNLVINGVDSMEGRGGTIVVQTETMELTSETPLGVFLTGPPRPGLYVTVVVEDRGSGMSEATLRRIGDPFFTTKSQGRGLGMTTVIGIVRGLDGALAVDSAVGRGTRFTVLLPIGAAAQAAPIRSILRPGPPNEPAGVEAGSSR